jgi:hypothetical protein
MQNILFLKWNRFFFLTNHYFKNTIHLKSIFHYVHTYLHVCIEHCFILYIYLSTCAQTVCIVFNHFTPSPFPIIFSLLSPLLCLSHLIYIYIHICISFVKMAPHAPHRHAQTRTSTAPPLHDFLLYTLVDYASSRALLAMVVVLVRAIAGKSFDRD